VDFRNAAVLFVSNLRFFSSACVNRTPNWNIKGRLNVILGWARGLGISDFVFDLNIIGSALDGGYWYCGVIRVHREDPPTD